MVSLLLQFRTSIERRPRLTGANFRVRRPFFFSCQGILDSCVPSGIPRWFRRKTGRQIWRPFSCAGGGVGNFFTGTASPSPHRQRVDFDAAVHGRRHAMAVLLRKSAKKADKRCGIPSNENSENTWNHDHDDARTGSARSHHLQGTLRIAHPNDPRKTETHTAGSRRRLRCDRRHDQQLGIRKAFSRRRNYSITGEDITSKEYPRPVSRLIFLNETFGKLIDLSKSFVKINSVSSAHGTQNEHTTPVRHGHC